MTNVVTYYRDREGRRVQGAGRPDSTGDARRARSTTTARPCRPCATEFPEMTRFGVMKHLTVLEAANLVVTTPSRSHQAALPQPGPDPARSPTAGSASTPSRSPARMVGLRDRDRARRVVTTFSQRSADMAITGTCTRSSSRPPPEQRVGCDHRTGVHAPVLPRHCVRRSSGEGRAISHDDRRRPSPRSMA